MEEVRDDFYSLAEKQLPLSSAADHPLLTRELIASFRHFVENMPPQRKKIFQLRFEENLNTKAIACFCWLLIIIFAAFKQLCG